MAQLYYRYSTMNAGKSIEVIKVAHNYEERGKRVLALVPGVDDRYGKGKITSRIGLSRDATIVNEDTNILEIFMRENSIQPIDCVVLDECQFLKKHHVEELIEIVDSFDIPVLAYGLKNDFKNELFEGSYYMLIYADKIEEIKTICWCGRKATMVARVVDGKFVKSGEQIPPEIVLHRISGDAVRSTLIAPEWSYKKRTILNGIHKKLAEKNTWQGKAL